MKIKKSRDETLRRVPVFILSVFLSVFLLPYPAWTESANMQIDPRWEQCSENADCVVIKMECGPECVNINFKEVAQGYLNGFTQQIVCWGDRSRTADDLMTTAVARCMEHQCKCLDRKDAWRITSLRNMQGPERSTAMSKKAEHKQYPELSILISPSNSQSRRFSLNLTNNSPNLPLGDLQDHLQAAVLWVDGKPHRRIKGMAWRGGNTLAPKGTFEGSFEIDDWRLETMDGLHEIVLEVLGQRSNSVKIDIAQKYR